jgi:hypothetical protein
MSTIEVRNPLRGALVRTTEVSLVALEVAVSGYPRRKSLKMVYNGSRKLEDPQLAPHTEEKTTGDFAGKQSD